MSGDLTVEGFENELSRSLRDLSYGINRDIQKGMYLVRPSVHDKRSVDSIVNRLADLFIEEQNGQNILRVSKQYLTFIPKMNTLSKLNLIILKGRFGCIEQSISRSC
jgi:hypothetical protein